MKSLKGRKLKKACSLALTGVMMITMMSMEVFAAEANGELSLAETVDSVSLGVNLELYDYAGPANIGGKGYDSYFGGVQQGMLSKVLGEDGFPVANDTNLSLKEWYSKDGSGVTKSYQNCNKLFSKSIYDSTGYLSYSSFSNFASIVANGSDSNNFTVYNQLATPNNSGNFYFRRGNFLPFNNIEKDSISTNTNDYNMDGKLLEADDSRNKERLYLTKDTNYYFGMYMSTGFNMLKDGQYNESDMVYEFNGDDDLWIYIDDVLVLDLGGIHDAHSGNINFATGKITEDLSSQKAENVTTTSLKQRFIDAGVSTEKVTELFGDRDTFKDNSSHVIKMFYMERGAGASNCYVKINLPTIPEEKVEKDEEIVPEEKVPEAEKPSEETPVVAKEEAPVETSKSDELVVSPATNEIKVADDASPETADMTDLSVGITIMVLSLGVMGTAAVVIYKKRKLA